MNWLFKIFVATAIVAVATCPLNASEQANSNYLPIGKVSASDWLQFSPDGDKLAVVNTVQSADLPPCGNKITVYSVNPHGQLGDKIFQEVPNNSIITEVGWVQGKLLYPIIKGFNSLDEFADWKQSVDLQTAVVKLPQFIATRCWNSETGQVKEIAGLKLFQPGVFLSAGKDTLVSFDPVDGSDAANFEVRRTVELFDLRAEQRIALSQVEMPLPAYRWWNRSNPLLVLGVDESQQNIIALLSSATSASLGFSRNRLATIISINGKTGVISAVTPDSLSLGLGLSGKISALSIGNPVLTISTPGKVHVVGPLDITNRSQKVRLAYGFWDLKGTLVKQQEVLTSDLQNAGIPHGAHLRLITWSPDGEGILLQVGRQVFFYKPAQKTAQLVTNDVQITRVVGWRNSNQVLVLSTKSAVTPGTSEWALLKIPEN